MIEQLREEIQTSANARNGFKAELGAEGAHPLRADAASPGCWPGRLFDGRGMFHLGEPSLDDKNSLLDRLLGFGDKLCLEHLARNYCFETSLDAKQGKDGEGLVAPEEITADESGLSKPGVFSGNKRVESADKNSAHSSGGGNKSDGENDSENSEVAASSEMNEISTEVVEGNIFKTLLDKSFKYLGL